MSEPDSCLLLWNLYSNSEGLMSSTKTPTRDKGARNTDGAMVGISGGGRSFRWHRFPVEEKNLKSIQGPALQRKLIGNSLMAHPGMNSLPQKVTRVAGNMESRNHMSAPACLVGLLSYSKTGMFPPLSACGCWPRGP